MTDPSVSAVLFARDVWKLGAFYRDVFGAAVARADAEHALLEIAEFQLVVHQIPAHLLGVTPPRFERRELGAVRLDFPVADVPAARACAAQFGGSIDAEPPSWAGADTRFFLGHDPEGNVFGVKGP